MADTIYNKGVAIRNTVVYALVLAGCLVGLLMWRSWFGRGLMAVAVVWAYPQNAQDHSGDGRWFE